MANASKNIKISKDSADSITKDSIKDLNRISNDEKEELLSFNVRESGLSKFSLFVAFCIMFLVLSVLLPKIYLSNNVYYVSRDISRLNAEKDMLSEEKIRLKREIEMINNKHLMLELGENNANF